MTSSSSASDGRTPPDGNPSGRESRPAGARADDEHPGIVLTPEMADERRTGRIRRFLMGTALAAAIAAGGYYVWGGDVADRIDRLQAAMVGQPTGQFEPTSGSSTEQQGQGNGRVASGGASVGDAAPPGGGEGPGTSVDPAVATFRARAEELMSAAARFRERSQDFRLGRIGCSDLVEGYMAVDRAMVDMAGGYLDAGSRLRPEEEELYRRAMDRADSIARSFDRSGCDRDF